MGPMDAVYPSREIRIDVDGVVDSGGERSGQSKWMGRRGHARRHGRVRVGWSDCRNDCSGEGGGSTVQLMSLL